MYYIISLKHTHRTDDYITLWRPDNSGYTYVKQYAGRYRQYKEGYHDQDGDMPIRCEELNKLFIEPSDKRSVLLNCKQIWKKLDVKMTKQGLVKL